MSGAGDRLFALLPAAVRNRDAEVGNPLQALLDIVGEQVDGIAASIDTAYEDLFIETCEDWVVPYLADLVGTVPLYDASRSTDDATALATFTDLRGPRLLAPGVASSRADVAKTIEMRRRKGTVSALGDVARYASGYPIRLVEGLARTGWTQDRHHLRLDLQTARIRDRLASSLVGTPFDMTTRFCDVRRPGGAVGWYHPAHELLGVYRLLAQRHRSVTARPGPLTWQFRLDPLGLDRPLFTRGGAEVALPRQLVSAAVPDTFSPALFEADLRAHVDAPLSPATGARPPYTALYADVDDTPGAPLASLGLWVDGVFATPAIDETAPAAAYQRRVLNCRLDPWPTTQASGAVVCVDVRNGRVAVGDGWGSAAPVVTGSFFQGTPGYSGGGDYERSGWLVAEPDEGDRITAGGSALADFPGLDTAIAHWATTTTPHTVIQLLDSARYDAPAALDLGGRTLVIEAVDGERPVVAPLGADGAMTVTGPGELTLTGLAVDGRLVGLGAVNRLRVLHSTLLPDGPRDVNAIPVAAGPSIQVGVQALGLQVEIAFSILGSVEIDQPIDSLLLLDSVVVGSGIAPVALGATSTAISDVTAERTTFLGDVHCRSMTASECLFPYRIVAERAQQGCLRYCYIVPDDPADPSRDSRTPRRFACQPDLAITAVLAAHPEATTPAEQEVLADDERVRVRPVFVSRTFGDPGLAQLDASCPAEIATGAADGSEMGGYSHTKQAQRLDNLSRRVTEFLPAGISAGSALIT